MMREPVLIFDFGNVVCHFDYLRACERFSQKLGTTAAVLQSILLERGFTDLQVRFESGRIGAGEFAKSVQELAGLDLTYEEFVAGWNDIFWLNEPVARIVSALKARGYTLLLGSNTNVLHAAYFRRRFAPTMNLFDHMLLSYEVGCMKPERGFYEACFTTAGVPAGRCVFIDDLPQNVDGAQSAGMMAVRYSDTPSLLAALRRVGVEVPPAEAADE
jgi:putative hydrolase of the HAD superfamily